MGFSKHLNCNNEINTAHTFQTSLNCLPSPTAFDANNSYLQSPTNSAMISSMTMTNNSSSISNSNHLNQYRLNNLRYADDTIDDENDDEKQQQQVNDDKFSSIVIKKGWMTKLGETFKTWKYRYFELWSNGLLNYFENEMKLKKKGSINIIDEVIKIELYKKDND